MNDLESITENIINTYESQLFTLSQKHQYHWCVRRFRVTKDPKYISTVFSDYQRRLVFSAPKIQKISSVDDFKRLGKDMLTYYSSNAPKKALRKRYYDAHPEMIYFTQLLQFLFLTKSYSLDNLNEIKELYDKVVDHVKQSDIMELLLDGEFILVNPSQVANLAYYLRFMDVVDDTYTQRIDESFFNVYSKKPENELDWHNMIYGFTHVIIAASYFYQRLLDPSRYQKVLDLFESRFDEFARKSNPDLIAEVGLCFKLCSLTHFSAYTKACEIIRASFDSGKGYIPRENNDSLQLAEHRNAVAVLLLDEYTNLHSGPDLYTFFNENKRGLYMPEKIKYIGSVSDEIES